MFDSSEQRIVDPSVWDHRADLAEQAVAERHSNRLWGLPGTNLGVICWPPTGRDRMYVRWHYWWQAHFVDCQVDALNRRATKFRRQHIRSTLRGIRVRNLQKLTKNKYFDDKAWLALAMGRVARAEGMAKPRSYDALSENIAAGVDSLTGVLPWRENEMFFNTPTNGPAAILAARRGALEDAQRLMDWTFENLVNDDGLIIDGLHMRMNGPEAATAVYSYCQGVVLGALVELAVAQRGRAHIPDKQLSDVGMENITRAIGLLDAIERTHVVGKARSGKPGDVRGRDVLESTVYFQNGGGDGGLFNGILMRYLALFACDLPEVGEVAKRAKRRAAQMVLATAETVWRHRLELDGLPVFGADWSRDAVMPQAGGLVGSTIAGAVASSDIAERDLSVQLSGWMLMEAAAKVSKVLAH